MSLTFIQEFQSEIYKCLNSSAIIASIIRKIYIGPVHNTKPPFISINIIRAEDKSFCLKKLYNIDFNISIFTKDKNYNQLLILSDVVTQELEKLKDIIGNYCVLGIKANKIDFVTAKDLVIHKADINYKSCITKRI